MNLVENMFAYKYRISTILVCIWANKSTTFAQKSFARNHPFGQKIILQVGHSQERRSTEASNSKYNQQSSKLCKYLVWKQHAYTWVVYFEGERLTFLLVHSNLYFILLQINRDILCKQYKLNESIIDYFNKQYSVKNFLKENGVGLYHTIII